MNRNISNILTGSYEVVLDSLIQNPILKELPFLNITVSIASEIASIRDQMYLNKVHTFIFELGALDEKKRKKLAEESRKDQRRRTKFGDAIFTVIEQSDSKAKLEYLASSFEGFLNGDYNSNEFREMCHVINNAFTDDLIDIIENDQPTAELKYLVPTGLADPDFREMIEKQINMEPNYEMSLTAMRLREAWRMYRKDNIKN